METNKIVQRRRDEATGVMRVIKTVRVCIICHELKVAPLHRSLDVFACDYCMDRR